MSAIMTMFIKEYQIWGYLADEYESGKTGGGGICSALSILFTFGRISAEQLSSCRARLRRRFRPRWWNILRVLNLPYYWPWGFSPVRARACDKLFHEAFEEDENEERERERMLHIIKEER